LVSFQDYLRFKKIREGIAILKAQQQKSAILEFCVKDFIENPLISIIVPVYNTEKYLFKCLMSLIKQTLKEIEIIIVNDGSRDNSAEIISMFEEADSRVKVINQQNLKQGAARNNGLKIAKGEYIGFVDSDDWVDLNYFEKLYNAAKKYDSDIAFATNVRIGNGKTKKRLNITEEKPYSVLEEKFSVCNAAKNPCPTNKIYRRTFLEKNNIVWPEGCYCEDKLFVVQGVYFANSVVSVPDVNYYYFRNPNSTVNSKGKRHLKKLLLDKNKSKADVINFLKEKKATSLDEIFWANTTDIRFLNIPLFTIKESILTKKYMLFDFLTLRKTQ